MKNITYTDFLKLDEKLEAQHDKFQALHYKASQSNFYRDALAEAAKALSKLQKELTQENYDEAESLIKEAKTAQSIAKDEFKKSRAADMAKSRAKASFIEARLTPKAEENLKKLCESTGLNKTQVINKLLEEQEQLALF